MTEVVLTEKGRSRLIGLAQIAWNRDAETSSELLGETIAALGLEVVLTDAALLDLAQRMQHADYRKRVNARMAKFARGSDGRFIYTGGWP